jgi:hypothetical protein
VVQFVQPQLALDAAWPDLSYDRVNDERASVMVGLFIEGSLDKDIPDVLSRIRKGHLFRKLVDHAVAAGPENCIFEQETAASWLSHQAAPTLRELRKEVRYPAGDGGHPGGICRAHSGSGGAGRPPQAASESNVPEARARSLNVVAIERNLRRLSPA